MGAIETKTFTGGNSVALRLPKTLGIGPDVAMRIERRGGGLTVVPVINPVDEKRKLSAMVGALRALPKPGSIEQREPIEIPDRPSL